MPYLKVVNKNVNVRCSSVLLNGASSEPKRASKDRHVRVSCIAIFSTRAASLIDDYLIMEYLALLTYLPHLRTDIFCHRCLDEGITNTTESPRGGCTGISTFLLKAEMAPT